MSKQPANRTSKDTKDETETDLVAVRAAAIEAAPTISEKSRVLWEMSPATRYHTLEVLPAPLVAALIESDPEQNTGLIANLPIEKFQQMTSLGTSAQGRTWLERAVQSGSLAGSILPSLMTANDLAQMIITAPDVRRSLPKLLNYERAERWSKMLTPNEYHKNLADLLMSDADEMLAKSQIKNKAIKAVLQSLFDFVPELYLETITLAMDLAKRSEDNPDEFEDLTATPFGLPEVLAEAEEEQTPLEASGASGADADSPLSDLIPEGGDPVFALAMAGLSDLRKAQLEDQLKNLLRQEVVSTASFAKAEIQRAAGRVLFYLRVGLESFGPTVGDTTRALETYHLNEISARGARAVETYRQRALALSGLRDWLDSRQRQFLDALKQPEAGIEPETREPVLWLASRPKQDRAEWHPVSLLDIMQQLSNIAAWGALARAAFGTPERVHAIYNTAKTRTWEEALRRTVLSLALYHRWEPELVRPSEDYADFQRQFGKGKREGIDAARQIVLDALDATPDGAWKPSDAKARARELLLRAVSEVETMPPPAASTPHRRS